MSTLTSANGGAPRRKKISVSKIFIYAAVILFTAFVLLPVYILLINATRTDAQIRTGFTLVPGKELFRNIQYLNAKSGNFNILIGYRNSLILAVLSPLLAVYFSALTAYGLTAYRFKGRNAIYKIILLTIMLPAQLSLVGFYDYMITLNGWIQSIFGDDTYIFLDSYVPLILPSIANAGCVFFMKQYLDSTFEKALVEAGRIDGAKEFLIFNKIMLPLMLPCVATMFIINFIGSWNNFLMPMLLITSPELYTMPMMVQTLQIADGGASDQAVVYTGLLLSVVPIILVFVVFSKWIVAGLTIGSVKG